MFNQRLSSSNFVFLLIRFRMIYISFLVFFFFWEIKALDTTHHVYISFKPKRIWYHWASNFLWSKCPKGYIQVLVLVMCQDKPKHNALTSEFIWFLILCFLCPQFYYLEIYSDNSDWTYPLIRFHLSFPHHEKVESRQRDGWAMQDQYGGEPPVKYCIELEVGR
jgi:hypothetical protein